MEVQLNVTPGMLITFMRMAGINKPDLEEDGVTSLCVTTINQNNQKKSKKMSNTAKSHIDIFKEMTEANSYAASNALMLGYNELENYYKFIQDNVYGMATTGSEEHKLAELEMNTILGVMQQRLALTKAYIEAQMSPINAGNLKPTSTTAPAKVVKEKEEEKPVIDLQTRKPVESVKSEETIEKKKKEDKPVPVVVQTGTLTHKVISDNVKNYLKEDKYDQALAFAKSTLGEGKYIPRKENEESKKWEEAKITLWLKHLQDAINIHAKNDTKKDNSDLTPEKSNVTPKEDKKKEEKETKKVAVIGTTALKEHRAMIQLRNSMDLMNVTKSLDSSDLSDVEKEELKLLFKFDHEKALAGFNAPADERAKLLLFCMPEQTLKEEEKKLTAVAKRFVELSAKGSEDDAVAREMVDLFFKYRGYTDKQIETWLSGISNASKAEELPKVKHFSLLGKPQKFFEGDTLKEASFNREQMDAIINNNELSDEEKIEEIVPHIAGHVLKLEGIFEPVYTDLHAVEVVKRQLKNKQINAKNAEMEKLENEVYTYNLNEFESFVKQAVNADVPMDDFIRINKDVLIRPDGEWRDLESGKDRIAINKEEDLVAWVAERYQVFEAERDMELEKQKENGVVSEESEETEKSTIKTPEYKKDDKIEIFITTLRKKVLSFKTYEDFVKDPMIADAMKYGIIVNAFEDPETKEKEIVYYNSSRSSRKELKKWIKAFFNKTHEEAKKEIKDAEIKISPVDTFEDGDVRVYSFGQLKEEGLKIKDKKTYEEMFEWVKKNVLNRRLDDQVQEEKIITDEKMITSIVEHMFGMKPESTASVTMTQEQADLAVDTLLKDKDTSLVTAVRAYKDMTKQMGAEISLSQSYEYVKKRAEKANPDKLKKILDRIEENKSRQIFIEEKFSTTHPEQWKEVKEITTLEELYNACKTYKDKEDWQTALSMALEVIKIGNIEDAKSWDKQAVTDWFNTKLLGDPIEESKSVEEVANENEQPSVEELEEDFQSISDAQSKVAFKRAIYDVLKNYENSKEARAKVIQAIKNGNGKHTRKVSKMPEGDMHKMINTVIKKAEAAEASAQ